MELPGRIARLRDLLDGAGCEALLVSSHSNIRYLTGFSGSAGLLMVRADDAVHRHRRALRGPGAGRAGPFRCACSLARP